MKVKIKPVEKWLKKIVNRKAHVDELHEAMNEVYHDYEQFIMNENPNISFGDYLQLRQVTAKERNFEFTEEVSVQR